MLSNRCRALLDEVYRDINSGVANTDRDDDGVEKAELERLGLGANGDLNALP